jgi:hypothetical protein
MKTLSSHGRTIGVALLLAIGAATASAPVAYAGPQGDIIIRQISPAEIQNLQSRQQRLNYQQRQQINREQDRTIQRPPRLEVPVTKPRCQPQVFGNSTIVRTCQ